MVNGKWPAFIQRLYPKRSAIDASHSPIHTHQRPLAAMQGTDHVVRRNLGLRTLRQTQGEIEPATPDCQTTALTS